MTSGGQESGGDKTLSAYSRLEAALKSSGAGNVRLVLEDIEDENGTSVDVPRDAVEAFARVLELLGEGAEVEILAKDTELTTQEAAEILNVSRPHLVDLLESGKLPFHKVGSHRRVELANVLEYKRARKTQSRKRMEELAREDEQLGLDY